MKHLRPVLTWLVQCYATIPAQVQRGRQLAGILVVLAIYTVLTLGNVIAQGETEAVLPTLGALGLLSGLWLLNRRGSVQAAALGLVTGGNGLVTAVLVWAPDPHPLINLAQVIAYIVVVALSGTFLSPRYTAVVCAGSLLEIYWLYMTGLQTPSFVALRTGDPEGLAVVLSFTSLALLSVAACTFIAGRLRRQAEGHLYQANAALTKQLTQRHQLSLLLLTAQEDERARMAAELHDGPLSELTALILGLDSLSRQPHTGDAVKADLHTLRGDARTIAGELRRLMNNLRPAILDDAGLEIALRQLAAKWQVRTGAILHLTLHLEERLNRTLETALFRVTQEALTNSAQHAQATQAWVTLEQYAVEVRLTIRDDGQGFAWPPTQPYATTTGHIGLALLMERVASLDGVVTLTTAPTHGTTIQCVFPLVLAPLPMERTAQPLSTHALSLLEDA